MFCCRLNDVGDLVRDVPILPGMQVWYVDDDRGIESLVVKGVSQVGGFPWKYSWAATDQPETAKRAAHRTYVTHEAALEGRRPCFSPGTLAAYWARIRQGKEADCWPWTGEVDDKGFGRVKIGSLTYPAHGIAYNLLWTGSVDAIAHKCGNKLCCNPKHMGKKNGPDERDV